MPTSPVRVRPITVGPVSVSPLQFNRTGGSVLQPNEVQNLEAWLKMDAGVTQAGTISAWADQTANNHNLDQGTGAKQPTYVASGLNGSPVARFLAASSQNFVTAGAAWTLTAASTIFVVCTKSAAGDAYVISGNGGSGSPAFLSNFNPNSDSFEWYNPGAGTDRNTLSAGATGAHILCIKQTDGVSLQGFIDGASAFSVVPVGALATVGLTAVGAANGGLANFYSGDLAEIVWYARNITVAEVVAVTRALGQKYGIATA